MKGIPRLRSAAQAGEQSLAPRFTSTIAAVILAYAMRRSASSREVAASTLAPVALIVLWRSIAISGSSSITRIERPRRGYALPGIVHRRGLRLGSGAVLDEGHQAEVDVHP